MPRYEFECPRCHERGEADAIVADRGAMRLRCKCGALMERVPSAPNFKVTGYNAKNGYGRKDE